MEEKKLCKCGTFVGKVGLSVSSYFPLVSSRATGRPENSEGDSYVLCINSHVLCIICSPSRNRVNVFEGLCI